MTARGIARRAFFVAGFDGQFFEGFREAKHLATKAIGNYAEDGLSAGLSAVETLNRRSLMMRERKTSENCKYLGCVINIK